MGEEELEEENQQPNSQIESTENSESPKLQDYQWPKIRFDIPPYRTYHFHKQFRTGPNPNNFLKGVKWSPDGSCFLASSEDNTLRLFSLPDYGSNDQTAAYSSVSEEDSYAAQLVVSEGESVYDFCWYPYMSSSDPVTCVFATSTRDHPIHLWDATSGLLRCTYRAYDAVDEITAAISVSFNPAGTKLFAGYNKSVRVFDVHRPGRDFAQYSTLQGNKEGQTGIISAIAFCPTHTGMLATGSYSQTTAIYREDNMELLYVLHGQGGGVTHVQFSKDGNYLYTGARKDPYIMCWDIRKAVEVIYKFYRSSESTNQRIAFDIDCAGQHLSTGGQDGLVHIYDLQTGQWVSGFQAAADTVNGFSFHPFLPMAVSSSGHRRFQNLEDDDDEDLQLRGDENCASVWSFSYDVTAGEQS
ncbi:Transducin/WD40 repeat-like superfamily protein isoform 2 [Hibiscus syriacus]|uniref:Transducin/WD40 repeat-like superfamily protein isoform 2 n=1 Tax=Hibiscus syriacus TaxID=106335 RepID=A0A6A2WWQ5_HIBSY|nr:telomerase Cajal body protein 1-like [Hibiscus syriacus]KAE8659735.1 Transducin/WD40 repeat-like superfamily protein isoform 2 [Hibiscus syriacus]